MSSLAKLLLTVKRGRRLLWKASRDEDRILSCSSFGGNSQHLEMQLGADWHAIELMRQRGVTDASQQSRRSVLHPLQLLNGLQGQPHAEHVVAA